MKKQTKKAKNGTFTDINGYLVKLFCVIKDMETFDLFSTDSKLSRTEFRLMREIALEAEKGKDIISSELARRLGITRSAVSQIVNKLEERGIVVRVPSEKDKKIAYVKFSDTALAFFIEHCERGNRLMERVTEELGEEKLKALFAAYDEFAAALKKAQKEIV